MTPTSTHGAGNDGALASGQGLWVIVTFCAELDQRGMMEREREWRSHGSWGFVPVFVREEAARRPTAFKAAGRERASEVLRRLQPTLTSFVRR